MVCQLDVHSTSPAEGVTRPLVPHEAKLALTAIMLLAAIGVGAQTYTLRNLNFDQMVEFCVKHKIKYIELIANHVDPKGPQEEIARKKAILEKNGLVAYTFGVNGTSLDKEENRKLFEFAKFMRKRFVCAVCIAFVGENQKDF